MTVDETRRLAAAAAVTALGTSAAVGATNGLAAGLATGVATFGVAVATLRAIVTRPRD